MNAHHEDPEAADVETRAELFEVARDLLAFASCAHAAGWRGLADRLIDRAVEALALR